MIVIVDLCNSNIGSVRQALFRVGYPSLAVATPETIRDASALLLPGVGAFGDGMESLRQQKLIDPICEAACRGVPVFGICLGMQLFASESEEYGCHQGLGLIPGRVIRLEATLPGYRVPNIGWCDVQSTQESIFFDANTGGCFYHVHSYQFLPENPDNIVAEIDFNSQSIVVAVQSGNLFGVQFHPEKSQDDGLELLSRFLTHLRATDWLN